MCEQVKTWIDEKGKEWETVKEVCPKCAGAGHIFQNGWQYYSNGACFKCEGKGYILTNRRVLTDKEKAAREKAKQRKEEKKKLERQQTEIKKENELNIFLQENSVTYICIDENSYDKKDLLKANDYKWLSMNWAGFKLVEGIETIAVNTIDVINTYTIKLDECKINDKVIEYWTNKELKEKEISQYIGSQGDKIEVKVTLESIHGYDTQYGRMYINLLKDEQGNILKWNSKNTLDLEESEYKTIKATIKGHEEYEGQKQTTITRCSIIESEDDKEEEKVLYFEEIQGYKAEIVLALKNKKGYIKTTTEKNDTIYYEVLTGNFKYKRGLKGIKQIKEDIENLIFDTIEEKINDKNNLLAYIRKELRKL